MSTLTPLSSARSLLSSKSNGHAATDQQYHTPGFPPTSFQETFQKFPTDSLNLSPNELFTKHTVSEVRNIRQRLSADADAKQEELRLMVGERYRDLLQASSSIISIASSSQRVLEALEESKQAILSQHTLSVPSKNTAIDGLDDKHLRTLQVLSAHMKVLLDAPEHLWRLIERKKYFHAGWLFLLSRVVYQALVRNEENDEQSWVGEGVDVLVEFPLVQRQWDVVSQFRSQIIHKSTLSLRESSASTEDTCATLVTLHLLDSRPLNDTLATLFFQRAKTLKSLLLLNPPSNGSDHTSCLSVREVIQAIKSPLSAISKTIFTARAIFQTEPPRSSLLIRVLESIQADRPESLQTNGLPDELSLSTQSLLTQLTSSANFQLLPPNLRGYRPYIDLNSSSTFFSQSEFFQKLQEWFYTSSKQWHESAEKLLSNLQSVKDVWSLRGSIRRYILGSGLEEMEQDHVFSKLDSLCHNRIIEIWKRSLSDAEDTCKSRLREFIFSPQGKDVSAVDFLFQPPPISLLSQSVKSFVDIPFQKYQLTLKRQLVGRSTQLDIFISTLEQCARTIQLDFLHLKTGDDKTTQLLQQLKKTYEPIATDLTIKITQFVNEVATEVIDTASSTTGLAFLSRVTANLAYSSSFIQMIGCTDASAQDFKESMISIHDQVILKWREVTIDHILQDLQPQPKKFTPQTPRGPSPQIFQALLALCDCIRQLGVLHHPAKQNSVAQELLGSLFKSWFSESHDHGEQTLYDIAFIQKLSNQYGQPWPEISKLVAEKLNPAVLGDAMVLDLEKNASEYLARTQTLLSSLLPSPAPSLDAPLLQFGIPSPGQSNQLAIEVAKPSPRFGMLLVGSADH